MEGPSNEIKEFNNNKEVLRRSVDYLREDVGTLLKDRADRESQKDHLGAVFTNSREILQGLYGRKLTEEEMLELELFEYAHDRGKWDQRRVEEIMGSADWPKVSKNLGLSKAEISILEKAKNGGFHLKDLAHHLYSAILWEADCLEGGKLSDLPEESKKKVRTAILEHHFEGYYKGVAIRNGLTEEEVAAVVRKPGEDLFSQACHDGDQLSMAQIGNFDGNEFHLGGYGKIVRLSAMFGLNGSNPDIKSLEDAFSASDKSVVDVGVELVTEEGKKMYVLSSEDTKVLKQAVLSDPDFSALRSAFRSGLDIDDQNALLRQLEIALRKHGEEILRRRKEKEMQDREMKELDGEEKDTGNDNGHVN